MEDVRPMTVGFPESGVNEADKLSLVKPCLLVLLYTCQGSVEMHRRTLDHRGRRSKGCSNGSIETVEGLGDLEKELVCSVCLFSPPAFHELWHSGNGGEKWVFRIEPA